MAHMMWTIWHRPYYRNNLIWCTTRYDMVYIIWCGAPYQIVPIIWSISYSSHHMNHIIWAISYGRYHMDHIISAISYGPYHMGHIILAILYGPYYMGHMDLFSNYLQWLHVVILVHTSHWLTTHEHWCHVIWVCNFSLVEEVQLSEEIGHIIG